LEKFVGGNFVGVFGTKEIELPLETKGSY